MSEKSVKEVLRNAGECVVDTTSLLERINVNENGFQDYLERRRQRHSLRGPAEIPAAARLTGKATDGPLIGASSLVYMARYAGAGNENHSPGHTEKRAHFTGPNLVTTMLVKKNVSETVLISRINLKLTKDSEAMKTERSKGSPSFGHFYSMTEAIPALQVTIDLEKLGRKLGVLLPDELLVG